MELTEFKVEKNFTLKFSMREFTLFVSLNQTNQMVQKILTCRSKYGEIQICLLDSMWL